MVFGMVMKNMIVLEQVQGSPGYPVQYSSTLECVRQMYAQEGLRSFWR
jgi:hypothetical protein